MLAVVLTLVGGLLTGLVAALLPLIGDLIPLVLNLNIATIISLLGL